MNELIPTTICQFRSTSTQPMFAAPAVTAEAAEAARAPIASSRSTLKLGAFLNSTQLASREMARSRQLAKWYHGSALCSNVHLAWSSHGFDCCPLPRSSFRLMLHCHAATPVLSVLGRTFATVTAKAQQHSGASTSLDVATRSALPMWGNAELSAAAALEARARLRDDPDVLGELHLWWLMAQNSIMPSISFLAAGTPSPRHVIANEFFKSNYVSLACLIANAMTQGRDAATVRAAAEEDWKADAADPSAAMNYWSFIDRVFEVCAETPLDQCLGSPWCYPSATPVLPWPHAYPRARVNQLPLGTLVPCLTAPCRATTMRCNQEKSATGNPPSLLTAASCFPFVHPSCS